ncbi:MAG: hypothetical protein RSE13_19215 [Planktothrix sp. GU0601_MAG3]|nr:MAG: hypothetical protein RSE13_19215 [Planktothrix sp. GU0601_MAG3]
MSNLSQWFQKTPQWLYWSLFPVLGGLAIVYAGSKTKTQSWVYTGLGFVAAAFILSNSFFEWDYLDCSNCHGDRPKKRISSQNLS